ncbi:3-oxoacyl-[acyl-carrier-protein] reductase FabG-like [Pecten maximus]|uniref:3-oxoacyl-[acyl-carrier-protein] reductase FabG-like n=1 Tax=Pecten maximus TaxID=6579 RepID=UPI001457F4D5|nr:3-oxoacyl-[acyl-carrier-protein] reductase FabG-like [Pecten maximus]
MASNGSVQRLDGKVALITGASSGIGRGTSILFAELGAQLALTGRNEENLQATAAQCIENGSKQPLLIVADMAIEEDVTRILNETIKHYGKLDILVNNAGIVKVGGIDNTSMADYDAVMNINVRAPYQLTMLAVPYLTKTKGTIVNVSSVNGMRSFPNVLAYCMSKSAVDQFTRCTALELASKGIRVNSVNPGVIITEIHKRGGKTEEQYQQFLEHCKTTHALGRVGQVEEVARTIAFLASDSSSFITGAQIPIDGGRHAMCPR